MKKLLIALFSIAFSLAVQAGDIYVITGEGTQLSGAEVRDVFIGEKQFAGSVKMCPITRA